MAGKAFLGIMAGLLLASAAHAEGFADAIVAELRASGFDRIETEQTWLGRTRIVAVGAEGMREIVINPATGEILRDLWLLQDGSDARPAARLVGTSDDDDDDDDGADDDDDDDRDDDGGDDGDDSGSGGGDDDDSSDSD